MTKGLPASGKSTWAKQFVLDNPNWKRINKDDLRSMLDSSKWSKVNEKFVLNLRDHIVRESLKNKINVIIDDTNLHSKHESSLALIAYEFAAEFEVKDFTDVPLEECINRDSKRINSVGKKAIMDMYNRFMQIKTKPNLIEYNPDLYDCYIFDIDGTLALMNNRSPFEWNKVGNDNANFGVMETFKRLRNTKHNPAKFIILSGRDEICRVETINWLKKNGIEFDALFMRPFKDNRKDALVKKEIYEREIKNKYNVIAILDDRNQVVDMWRSLDLTVFQVAKGDF